MKAYLKRKKVELKPSLTYQREMRPNKRRSSFFPERKVVEPLSQKNNSLECRTMRHWFIQAWGYGYGSLQRDVYFLQVVFCFMQCTGIFELLILFDSATRVIEICGDKRF
ncbi:hypothetical protein NPIL_582221 [Nephila pilipes]|uniref:Uncharacterized protein n=1 Tax=Nephila pilipes TaxID=299642 RepID=A0A8X6N950_NEPPI|nr:hypothetical protein NPIL_582221 [Nephila pilipes]